MNDRAIDDFMRLCRDHYNGYVPPTDSVEDDWKSTVFKKKTRNKVIATIASFLSSGIGLDISAQDFQEKIDRAMSKVVDDVYEWSLEREDFNLKLVKGLLEMIITGTVHIQEDIVWKKREVKEITDIDLETGEVKHEKMERTIFKGAMSEVVPNEEMFPGDVWTFDIQEQPYIVRRQITTYEAAMDKLSRYADWKFVAPGGSKFLGNATEDDAEDNGDEDSNEVEIVYYWSKADDLFAVVANGVLLTKPDNPIPYPHKNYPFAKAVYEPFADGRFYWGDSLPNKNLDEQETINDLYRMFIDSTKLKNKPPLFTPNAEMAGTDLIIPGAVNAGELADQVKTIPEIAGGVSNSEFNMLQLMERQVDENSIDPLLSGQQPSGDPTATEVRAVVGSSERVRSFNEQFIGSLLMQHAHLRVPNMLWFLTHDDEYQKVVLDDVKTRKGAKGRRQITFSKAGDIPTSLDLFRAEKILEDKGMPMNFVFVDKDAVNDYRFHVTISAVKRPTRSAASRLARVFSKFRLYSQNQLIDQVSNTRMLVEALGDDPDEMMQRPQVQPQGAGQQPPGQVKLPPNNQALDKQLAPQQEEPLMNV